MLAQPASSIPRVTSRQSTIYLYNPWSFSAWLHHSPDLIQTAVSPCLPSCIPDRPVALLSAVALIHCTFTQDTTPVHGPQHPCLYHPRLSRHSGATTTFDNLYLSIVETWPQKTLNALPERRGCWLPSPIDSRCLLRETVGHPHPPPVSLRNATLCLLERISLHVYCWIDKYRELDPPEWSSACVHHLRKDGVVLGKYIIIKG